MLDARIMALFLVGCAAAPSGSARSADDPTLPPQDASEARDAHVLGPERSDLSDLSDLADLPDLGDTVDLPAPLSCSEVVTIETDAVPQRFVHVALDGSDDGDGTLEAPWATLEFAAARLVPGDALRIHPGTWSGGHFLVDVRGAPGAPIWIGGLPDEPRPTIDAAGVSEGLHLVRPRFVVVHDLVVRGASDNGINVDDGGATDDPEAARYVVLRGLRIEDIGPTGNHDCLKLSGLNDFHVLNSSFSRCGSGGSAVDHVGCHRGVLARNSFSDLGSSGIQAKGGTTDLDIRWNRFTNAGARPVNMGGSTGLAFFRPPASPNQPNAEARRIHVLGNLIQGGESAAAFTGCVDCVFAHNTVVRPERWVVRILQETTSQGDLVFERTRDGLVYDNLIVFRADELSTTVNIGPNTQPETFVFAHNLWFAEDAPGQSTPSLPTAEIGGIVGTDPRFDDGFAIRTDSPAADSGWPDTPVLLTADITGACRPHPPSIGAWEAPPF